MSKEPANHQPLPDGLFPPKPPPQRIHERPLLIALSAPSGAGKSTLCSRLIKEHKGVAYSISCTTRAPRGEEQDGKDYYFLTKREFKQRVRGGEFLEHAQVHGHAYGTLKQSVEFAMEEGMHIIMDIDVQGVSQLRATLAEMDEKSLMRQGFVDIFLQPPSLEELSRRLHARGTDSSQVIEQRLERAKAEMECASSYTHVIINDQLEAAYDQLVALTVSRA